VRTQPNFLISTLDPLQDAWFSHDIQKHGMWEVHSTQLFHHVVGLINKKHGSKDGVVVDIGANHGFFALYAAAMGLKVSAWEAVPSIAAKLKESVILNGWADRLFVSNSIITTKTNKKLWVSPFVLGPSPTAYVRFDNKKADHEMYDKLLLEVEGVRTDKGVKDHGFDLNDVRVLKIDVEGCELDALLSATEILTASGPKPELFVEICPHILTRCQTTHADEVRAWKLLLTLKYAMRVYWHDAGNIRADFAKESVSVTSFDGKVPFHMWRVPNKLEEIDDWIQAEKNGPECFLMWASQLF